MPPKERTSSSFRLTWSAKTPIIGPKSVRGSIHKIGIVETKKGEPVVSYM